jgi:hypothetical protein
MKGLISFVDEEQAFVRNACDGLDPVHRVSHPQAVNQYTVASRGGHADGADASGE